ncbi:hypothetical protein HDU83_005308 [Entophlyctis luteolus]|nr:hypothetical protein HDU83_005308 [Entophlyctis luteolus]
MSSNCQVNPNCTGWITSNTWQVMGNIHEGFCSGNNRKSMSGLGEQDESPDSALSPSQCVQVIITPVVFDNGNDGNNENDVVHLGNDTGLGIAQPGTGRQSATSVYSEVVSRDALDSLRRVSAAVQNVSRRADTCSSKSKSSFNKRRASSSDSNSINPQYNSTATVEPSVHTWARCISAFAQRLTSQWRVGRTAATKDQATSTTRRAASVDALAVFRGVALWPPCSTPGPSPEGNTHRHQRGRLGSRQLHRIGAASSDDALAQKYGHARAVLGKGSNSTVSLVAAFCLRFRISR